MIHLYCPVLVNEDWKWRPLTVNWKWLNNWQKSTPVFKDEIKLSFIGNVYTQSFESSLLFVEDYAQSYARLGMLRNKVFIYYANESIHINFRKRFFGEFCWATKIWLTLFHGSRKRQTKPLSIKNNQFFQSIPITQFQRHFYILRYLLQRHPTSWYHLYIHILVRKKKNCTVYLLCVCVYVNISEISFKELTYMIVGLARLKFVASSMFETLGGWGKSGSFNPQMNEVSSFSGKL